MSGIPACRGEQARVGWSRLLLGHLFKPFPHAMEMSGPEEGCSVAQGAAELTVCFNSGVEQPKALSRLVVCLWIAAASLSKPVTPPLANRLKTPVWWCLDMCVDWFIMRKSCADRQPHSLVLNNRDVMARDDQDHKRWIGMQWIAKVSYWGTIDVCLVDQLSILALCPASLHFLFQCVFYDVNYLCCFPDCWAWYLIL